MYLVLLGLAAGCERNVPVDLPGEPARLVVNAFFTPDSAVRVQVSRSLSVLERPRLLGVEEAEVKLYEEGREIAVLRPDSLRKFVYQSGGKPVRAGKSYAVVVSALRYEPATAENGVPLPVPIRNIAVNEAAGLDLNGGVYNVLRVALDDPAGEENYYAVRVKAVAYETRTNPQTGATDTLRRETFCNLFAEPTVSGFRADQQLLFADRSFDGRTAELLSYFYPLRGAGRPEYRILLLSVSKTYYEYHRRLPDHLNNQSFEIIGGEPVPMPGNITNGYGIFAGYSVHEVVYK
ncbi:MAG: DUF4249 domain-containing protein [Cytophagales bacterium]|nr:DUF4249 domain-containing protein [Cytophagales bacterium]